MPIVAVMNIADLPAPGQPPEDIETVVPGSLFRKDSGYNSVELAISLSGSANFALYSYWQEDKSWKPEGPRGTTPVLFVEDTGIASLPDRIPARISVPSINRLLCVVKVEDVDDPDVDDPGNIVAILQQQMR